MAGKCLRSCVCSRREASDEESEETDMRIESHRLKSLAGCKSLCVDGPALALQGFFLLATVAPDEVQCVFCDVRISHWEADDDPVREHLRISNNCPLLRGVRTDNVPLDERLLQRLLKRLQKQYLSTPTSPFVHEEKRLESFVGWPGDGRDLGDLARDGFFYVGSGWRVECIFCHMRCEARPPAGDVLARHLEASDCPLFMGRISTNVPLEAQQFERLIYEVAGQRPSSDAVVLPAETHAAEQRHRMPQRDPRRVRIVSNPMSERYITVPHFKDLHMERNRRNTFNYWRGEVDRNELARLGFFYTGRGDSVQCIFCHVQMSNWHPDSDILEEHMSCSRCPLMRSLPTANVPLNAPSLNKILDEAFDITPAEVLHPLPMEESESDDGKKCKICFDSNSETVYVPCGHVGMCSECANRVDRCPFCRQSGHALKIILT